MLYRRPSWFLFYVLPVLAGLTACTKTRMPGPVSATPRTEVREEGFSVGTERVDITPPPGVSTFGHGPDALATSGIWTRLQCRIFVIRSASGQAHAIVPCELPAISGLLHRQVGARLLERLPPSQQILPTRLLITAVHTHAGPAHYFESPAFGGMLSTRRPGFDPKMLDFLASRIADGIVRALARSRPAELRWLRRSVWGLTRNRNLGIHLANRTHVPLDGELVPCPEGLSPAQCAIDPGLDVLELRDHESQAPLGMLAFFAMHPTVLPAHERSLGADTAGVAARVAERELRRLALHTGTEGDPLVGLINTNEGDISPAWLEGTKREALRLGTRLGAELWEATRDPEIPWSHTTRLDSRYLELDFPHARFQKSAPDGSLAGPSFRVCPSAVLGEASGHGGNDHEASTLTLLDPQPIGSEAEHDPDLVCHEPKRRMLGFAQPLLLTQAGFPEILPVSLFRLGQRWLAAVPAELTLEAGRRLRRSIEKVAKRVDGPGTRALVAGLGNGYLWYVTTPEEYERQGYEGASTLYGPNTLDLLIDRFLQLSFALASSRNPMPMGVATAFEIHLAPERDRLPTGDGMTPPEPRLEGACRLEHGPSAGACVWWQGGRPGSVPLGSAPWVRLVDGVGKPLVGCGARFASSVPRCDPRGYLDDRGAEFETRLHERIDSRTTRWISVYSPVPEFTPESSDLNHAHFTVENMVTAAFGSLPVCNACERRFCAGVREPLCANSLSE